jgi:AAA domain/RepB DNA-primase N-terminal domain
MPSLRVHEQLNLISRAWGEQEGYVFFPWVPGKCLDDDERKENWHGGKDTAFWWPGDRDLILEFLAAHPRDDVYWTPSLFEYPERTTANAMEEQSLWADLDEVNPHTIPEELRPTIAYETSPGRYQAIWVLTDISRIGLSWPGNENQRLTYHLDADKSGWDTTQLLRIPGRDNYKPEYKQNGKPVSGKLLWADKYPIPFAQFEDLPEVRKVTVPTDIQYNLDEIDRKKLWKEVRLKLKPRVRETIEQTRPQEGQEDRSRVLFWLEQCLAEAGCTIPEIVVIVRDTIWNKFQNRPEMLEYEAAKAIANLSEEERERIEDEEIIPAAQNLHTLIKNLKPTSWLVEGILAEKSPAIFAGGPKSHKSFCALDLAYSVATSAPLLNHFPVHHYGPVLYVQEEDGAQMVRQRAMSIWRTKQVPKLWYDEGEGTVKGGKYDVVPEINAMIRKGMDLSDTTWFDWLDRELAEGYNKARPGSHPYVMVIIDPLMMVMGEVDGNNAGMLNTRILKPLKQLIEKYEVAIVLVHHFNKSKVEGDVRLGGQMLGSQALNAWWEDILFFSYSTKSRELTIGRESKHTAKGGEFMVNGIGVDNRWNPEVAFQRDGDEQFPTAEEAKQRSRGRPPGSKAIDALRALGPGSHGTLAIQERARVSRTGALKTLNRAVERGEVERIHSNGSARWKLRG